MLSKMDCMRDSVGAILNVYDLRFNHFSAMGKIMVFCERH